MGKNEKYDKIVVLDLELTCWDNDSDERGDQPNEIIEVGACFLVAENLEILNKKRYLVKPVRSVVSAYCTELTGITPKMAKSGMQFKDVCNKIIKDFGTLNRTLATWGNGDKEAIRNACYNESIAARYPFGASHINVANMFMLCEGIKTKPSVSTALQMIGLEFDGRQHSAADDAYNTALIFKHVIQKYRKKNET